MTLHLVKLCVGVDTVEDLQDWVTFRLAEKRRAGEPVEHFHTTRMMPRRGDELLDGGSLYWVIRGNVQVRQRLQEIRPFRDKDGIRRCKLVLEPKLVLTEWQPRRAFQGWRYLAAKDAPRDIAGDRARIAALTPKLRRELAELGLL
ncbi:MAG: DUF1489 family protein [Alphaproteobacteria bacterium]|nr:DUF1489 family protein [Alphaproteobacteria bacterium]